MTRWKQGDRDAGEYDQRWVEAAAEGKDIHGEAGFVASVTPAGGNVLDAGCGTGRVAIELARRGFEVVGADLDARMLEGARGKAPELSWVLADLAGDDLAASLGRSSFDTVVAAGNVMIFLEPGSEGVVVRNLAGLLKPGGSLIAGFQLDGHFDLADYDRHCEAAGLSLSGRWATWDREPWQAGGDYAVSLHLRP